MSAWRPGDVFVDDDLTPEQLDEIYGKHANEVGVKRESLAAQHRRFGRTAVRDDELDTDLIDLQYGDMVAGDGIGNVQGNPAARQEFDRRLREAES